MKCHPPCFVCLFAGGLVAVLALAGGCVSPPRATAMKATAATAGKPHPYSVWVQVEGGSATDPNLGPEISSISFREALVASLQESRTFSGVRTGPSADFRLEASLVRTRLHGCFGLTVTQSTRWKLVRLSDNQVELDEFIEAHGQANLGDAFAGVTRLRIAQEKAGGASIRQGLQRLSELRLR